MSAKCAPLPACWWSVYTRHQKALYWIKVGRWTLRDKGLNNRVIIKRFIAVARGASKSANFDVGIILLLQVPDVIEVRFLENLFIFPRLGICEQINSLGIFRQILPKEWQRGKGGKPKKRLEIISNLKYVP